MTAELIATLILIGWSVAAFFSSFIIFRWIFTREYSKVKTEIEEIIQEKMQGALDAIGEVFEGIMTEPTVKKAFTILGKQGGDARAESALIDTMATDILDGPQFAAIRMGAEAMGLHLDEYIENHGALKTIQAAQQIAKVMGIDITKLDLGNLGGSLAAPGGGNNPYFRR
jgi:hypothetical protein